MQTGPGKGIGGFAAIAPGVFGPDQTETLLAHTIGNSSSKEVVGGPGSQTAAHACDGKGIDYIDACFGEYTFGRGWRWATAATHETSAGETAMRHARSDGRHGP